jgi:hypothetical protein
MLPDLFEGHASITLQNAFYDALEALEEWGDRGDEPLISVNGVDVPISEFLRTMGTCTDMIPHRTLSVLEAIVGREMVRASGRMLFADAVRLAMPLCAERLSR